MRTLVRDEQQREGNEQMQVEGVHVKDGAEHRAAVVLVVVMLLLAARGLHIVGAFASEPHEFRILIQRLLARLRVLVKRGRGELVFVRQKIGPRVCFRSADVHGRGGSRWGKAQLFRRNDRRLQAGQGAVIGKDERAFLRQQHGVEHHVVVV